MPCFKSCCGKVKNQTKDENFIKLLKILEEFDDKTESKYDFLSKKLKAKDLTLERAEPNYEGQTVLHVAISKGNVDLINDLFRLQESKAEKNPDLKMEKMMLTAKATGRKFKKTVLLGEQPLIVAALTLKEDIFMNILNRGERIKQTDGNLKADDGNLNAWLAEWLTEKTEKKGNNILHCLITYSHLFPNKKNRVQMFRKVIEEMERIEEEMERIESKPKKDKPVPKLMATLLDAQNKKGHTPLVHAAYLGQVDFFKILIEKKHYCDKDTKDALFDIKLYKTNDIDTCSENSSQEGKTNDIDTCSENSSQEGQGNGGQTQERTQHASILRIVHNSQAEVAAALVRVKPINRAIRKKWKRYQPVFYPFLLIHFIYMLLLTWYSVERSVREANRTTNEGLNHNDTCPRSIYENGFTTSFHFVSLLIALPHLFLEVVRISADVGRLKGSAKSKHMRKIGRPCKGGIRNVLQLSFKSLCLAKSIAIKSFDNAYGNIWFRLCFVLMSGFLIVDLGLVLGVECYDNYMLLCAVVTGWFACLFFVRAFKRFSFFTVLIQKVMLNELLSFFIVYLIELVALGTAFHMLIQGSEIQGEDDYKTYLRVLFAFAQLTIGTGELNGLYSLKYAGLAIAVFIVHVVITIILLLNALIAVLSNSSTVATEGEAMTRNSHFYLQRLAIILFIEDSLIFRKCKCPAGIIYKDPKDPKKSNKVMPKIKIKSLRKADDPDEVEEVEIYEHKDEENDVTEIKPRSAVCPFDHNKHRKCELDVHYVTPDITRFW